ncbi:Cysteine--tRNA ligase [uncultured archaeon]|nr:Cysteine--tRNA ligase [uncultured archaeon]
MLRVFNSLTRRKEAFRPLSGKNARLYTCGPTVYARPHLGNFRTYLYEDVVKRYLAYLGFSVKHAMNITDFDNTVLKEARKTGIPRRKLTRKFERLFRQDLRALGILPADKYPHVSQYADKMEEMVDALVAKGAAYRDKDGRVFFDVSAYPSYGKLVGQKLSSRKGKITWEEYKPWQAGDFLLWQPCGSNPEKCIRTRKGLARPAWNIQCAAMSTDTLGSQIDIAMGGRDNLFNHHENTRALAGALSGKEYAKYFMHVRHLIIYRKKMSKSKGNAVLLSDIIREEHSPKMVRLLLLSVRYRYRLNYTSAYRERMKRRYLTMKKEIAAIKKAGGKGAEDFDKMLLQAKAGFESSMDDDFDVPAALGAVEKFLARCSSLPISRRQAAQALALLRKFDSVLGFLPL